MNGQRRLKSRTAFTYVEMLVVLVLIGMLAGAAVVSLRGRTQTFALRTATKDLAAALRHAQEEARLRQCPHRVVFSEDTSAYRVESAPHADPADFTAARGRAGRMCPLPRGVHVAAVRVNGREIDLDSVALEFGPGGPLFSGHVRLVNDAGEVAWIEVVRGTGQIHVRETIEAEEAQ